MANLHPSPPSNQLRVLVVDDNRDTTSKMATLLRLHGHETRCCADGVAALRLALDWQPDVILLDLCMPTMGGLEVASRLRDAQITHAPFIIVVSGFAGVEELKRSKEAGIDLHLAKPADPDYLIAILRGIQDLIPVA